MPRTIIHPLRLYPAGACIIAASNKRRAVMVMLDADDSPQYICIGQPKPAQQADLLVHPKACPMYLTFEHHGDVVTQAWYAFTNVSVGPFIIWEILDE